MRSTRVIEASNLAWHIRVNGPDKLSEQHVREMAEVCEYLSERERRVTELLQQLDQLPKRTRDAKAMLKVKTAAAAVRKFKLSHQE